MYTNCSEIRSSHIRFVTTAFGAKDNDKLFSRLRRIRKKYFELKILEPKIIVLKIISSLISVIRGKFFALNCVTLCR